MLLSKDDGCTTRDSPLVHKGDGGGELRVFVFDDDLTRRVAISLPDQNLALLLLLRVPRVFLRNAKLGID